jgi:hypothetical protein
MYYKLIYQNTIAGRFGANPSKSDISMRGGEQGVPSLPKAHSAHRCYFCVKMKANTEKIIKSLFLILLLILLFVAEFNLL